MPSPISDRGKNTPIVEMERVSFSYSQVPVLEEISFSIRAGQFIGLIGPNGGGKTTLLKLILGFLKPASGTIKLFGQILNSSSHPPVKVAYVPQAVHCDRDFPISAEEVVLSGLSFRLPWYGRFHSSDRQAAREMLETMQLAHVADAPFGTLSGGQAQRLLIARALVSQPELLLLDEPTASVDSQAEADIYALLRSLQGKMTILMVTHDLRAAMEQVESLLCLQRTLSFLKPEEVCRHFALGLYQKS